ncbi:MAG: PIN domain-containing protein [Rhizobiales bacterium]|nr:PIN domain-containing protein [Hyphomicrobiales bacterium]
MRAALDSNFIIYAEDMFADARREQALQLLERIPAELIVIPVQAAGEVFNWLIRKGKVPKALAGERTVVWIERYRSQPTTADVLKAARELVGQHDFQVWDAVVLASAAEAGAGCLLSEDMQDGFKWRGVTVVNPFLDKPSPIISNLVKQ